MVESVGVGGWLGFKMLVVDGYVDGGGDSWPACSEWCCDVLSFANFPIGYLKVNKALLSISLVMLWRIWKWQNKVVHARSEDRSSIVNSSIVKEVQVLSQLWIQIEAGKQ
nr:hypothetical protein [Tanacetum cinerariifolium]